MKSTKKKYILIGGPFNGERLFLASPGTAVFKVGNYCGYYDHNGKWIDL